MVGACDAFTGFLERLRAVAASDATVLILGESGSGKDLAARTLHRLSPRSGGPFVGVNLAALSPSLVEAELFGHEAGAFTGATHARSGRFRQAEGGTLLLDDILSMPSDVQPKLLRVLQERSLEPLGSERSIAVDVRLVATARRDLLPEVEAGRLRGDLYYRLAVVPLEVPPLRARLEDLPELVDHLTLRLCERHGLRLRRLEGPALERLRGHPWPGNVRELENALERVLVLGPQGETGAAAPPGEGPAIRSEELDFLDRTMRGAADDLAHQALSQGLSLGEIERALLEQALEENRGNVSAAARQVGLTRRAFEYRLTRGEEERSGDETSRAPSIGGGR